MSDNEKFDWEGSTAAAWRSFQAQLADHLLEMGDDDLLLLEGEPGAEQDGAAPYVHFCGRGTGQLRCEAVGNHALAQLHQLDGAAQARLAELGFEPPESAGNEGTGEPNYWLDVDTTEADRLAVIAVRALRDVYGVAHPAFLAGHPLDEGEPPSETAAASVPDDTLAVYPVDGYEQLQRLVDEALTPWLGHPPVHDDDGDVPIDCGAVTVFIRVLTDRPTIRLFACVASDVDDLERAAAEVAILNRDRPFFKFLLLGDAIVVHTDLLAWPFAAPHLRDLATQLCRSVDQIQGDLEVRLASEPEESDGDDAAGVGAHPAMLTLLELDAAEPGSVDARLAASICEHDRDLVLGLLIWNEEQEVVWRQARDEALDDEGADVAEACTAELEQVQRTIALLRGALRVTVERTASRHDRDQARRHGRRPLPPRSGLRVPGPTLEGVDPEMGNR